MENGRIVNWPKRNAAAPQAVLIFGLLRGCTAYAPTLPPQWEDPPLHTTRLILTKTIPRPGKKGANIHPSIRNKSPACPPPTDLRSLCLIRVTITPFFSRSHATKMIVNVCLLVGLRPAPPHSAIRTKRSFTVVNSLEAQERSINQPHSRSACPADDPTGSGAV